MILLRDVLLGSCCSIIFLSSGGSVPRDAGSMVACGDTGTVEAIYLVLARESSLRGQIPMNSLLHTSPDSPC